MLPRDQLSTKYTRYVYKIATRIVYRGEKARMLAEARAQKSPLIAGSGADQDRLLGVEEVATIVALPALAALPSH